MTVAVLDTGVAYRTSPDRRYLLAPDLDRTRFVRGYDFVRDNTLPYDRNGHGTFVAGVIAQATNNGIGLTGVAYHSRIMPVRVLDYEGKGDVATIARGIRFAARRGARVINMSFEFDIGLTSSEIPDVLSAVRYAHRKGVVMVAAAGNTEETRIAYPGARAPGDRRGRHHRARLRRRLLQLRQRSRPRRTGRRRGRVHRHRRQLQAARGPGPRRLPVHVPRSEPAQVRAAERLRGHVDGRAARDRHDRADARRPHARRSAPRPRRSRRGSIDRARPRPARLRPALRLGPAERGRRHRAAAPPPPRRRQRRRRTLELPEFAAKRIPFRSYERSAPSWARGARPCSARCPAGTAWRPSCPCCRRRSGPPSPRRRRRGSRRRALPGAHTCAP